MKKVKKVKYALKLVLTLSYGLLTYASYHKRKWPLPDASGPSNAYGVTSLGGKYKLAGT